MQEAEYNTTFLSVQDYILGQLKSFHDSKQTLLMIKRTMTLSRGISNDF